MTERLSEAEIGIALTDLDGWDCTEDGKAITKQFKFRNFMEAIAFMVKVATVADKIDHHPDWRNVYNTVDVTLSTHDKGGLTELDFKLAYEMDQVAS